MKLETRPKIDEIDAEILKALLKEARTTFTEIAKDCKISIGAVRARYKKLKKEGIINGAIMQVNPYSLGYKCVCDIRIKVKPVKFREVIEFIEKRPYPKVIFEPQERSDITVVLVLPSIKELRGVLEELEASPHIKHVESLIWAETVNMDHAENLVLNPNNITDKKKALYEIVEINQNETDIDETDRRIAEILANSARTPFRKIAKQINVSTKNVIQRYKRLRGSVLDLSTITVNLQKLGYKAIADLFIKVANKSETTKVFSELLQIPNLIVAIRFIGHYDIKAIVVLADFEDLFSLKEKIDRIHGIEQTDIFIVRPFHKWPINIFTSTLAEPIQSKTVLHHPTLKKKPVVDLEKLKVEENSKQTINAI
jgi:Lrp/AsnC family transcriptional regulator for asnA, asnC and gidA